MIRDQLVFISSTEFAFGARRVVEQAHPFFELLLADSGPGVLRAAVAPVPDEVHRADSVGEGAPVAGIRQWVFV